MKAQTDAASKPMNERSQGGESPERLGGFASKTRKGLLWLFVGSLGLSAAIVVCLSGVGQWSYIQERTFATTLSISFCSMTALASAAALSRRRDSPQVYGLSIAGVAVSVVTFALFLTRTWLYRGVHGFYDRIEVIAGILSLSLGQACLLSLASLPDRLRWVYGLTLCAIAAVAALSSCMLIFELNHAFLFRVLGVLGFLDACGTLAMPILAQRHSV
jgi:hypothetical protein